VVYHAGQDYVTAPVVIERVKLQYTDEARAARIAVVVSLECVVKKDGTVTVTKVLEGLGYGLDENARAALKLFRFRPGMKDGKPVDVAFVAKIKFHIPPR
jgi:protein TonB